MKSGGRLRCEPPEIYHGRNCPNKSEIMIIKVSISIKEILEQGEDFSWPRPTSCPCCQNCTVWGHGHVWAYFDEAEDGIYLRRWRCPVCKSVHRMKPAGYFPRFWASVDDIRQSLAHRLKYGVFSSVLSANRQRHWFNALKRNVIGRLGLKFLDDLSKSFELLLEMGLIPVGRAI